LTGEIEYNEKDEWKRLEWKRREMEFHMCMSFGALLVERVLVVECIYSKLLLGPIFSS
jgi:hypothetical protein